MVTLIKNIYLVDGSGRPPFKADVLVKDGFVAALGSFPNYKADKTIFGNENFLVPGFIDVDASSDRYMTLFTSPSHKDFVLQGITSVMIGHCGFSLAPTLYGNLEHFFSWTKTNRININWRSMGEFLSVLSKRPLGLNVGTLAGHKVMREDILKDPGSFRKLTANELRVLRLMLSRALEEGAFGLSTGLGYYPYQNTSYHEIRALADVLHQHGAVYTTHLKNEKEKLVTCVEETVKLSQDAGITSVISHLRPFIGFEDEYKKAREIIETKTARADVYFDINPFSASAVSLDALIPDAYKKEDRSTLVAKLKDASFIKNIASEFPHIDSKKIVILNAPEMGFLNGKTLYDFAQTRQLSAQAALATLMEITKLRGVVFYENLSQLEIDAALLSPRSLISTNSPSFDDVAGNFKPDRSTKTFTTYLSSAQAAHISIEKAIAKITGLPAKLFNLDGRGFISPGYAADLVLLTKDLTISSVLVNGSTVVEGGAFVGNEGAHVGSVLKKGSS